MRDRHPDTVTRSHSLWPFVLRYPLVLHVLRCRTTPYSSPCQTPVRQGRVGGGRPGGGRGRNPDVLMEIQLSKVALPPRHILLMPPVSDRPLNGLRSPPPQVRFQHEVYPQAQGDPGTADRPVSRQVFTVQDLEIRDRLATSQMNKFLYLYSSKEMPRKAHSNMVRVVVSAKIHVMVSHGGPTVTRRWCLGSWFIVLLCFLS